MRFIADYILWIVISALVVLGILFLLLDSLLGLVFLILAACMLFFWKDIPAKPPSVGVPTIWGERQPIIRKEGKNLVGPYFPFFYNIQIVGVTKINKDFPHHGVRCSLYSRSDKENYNKDNIQAGGAVSVEVSFTGFPDKGNGTRLIEYLDSGEEAGVLAILEDIIDEIVRNMAEDYTWEEITFQKDVLRIEIISKLTGYTPDPGEELAQFVKRAQGKPDIVGLGILISNINVKHIIPEGKLLKDAEGAAREDQQRRSVTRDHTTLLDLLKLYKDAMPEVKDEAEIMRFIQINQKRAQAFYIEAGGNANKLMKRMAASGVVVGAGIDSVNQSKRKKGGK